MLNLKSISGPRPEFFYEQKFQKFSWNSNFLTNKYFLFPVSHHLGHPSFRRSLQPFIKNILWRDLTKVMPSSTGAPRDKHVTCLGREYNLGRLRCLSNELYGICNFVFLFTFCFLSSDNRSFEDALWKMVLALLVVDFFPTMMGRIFGQTEVDWSIISCNK